MNKIKLRIIEVIRSRTHQDSYGPINWDNIVDDLLEEFDIKPKQKEE